MQDLADHGNPGIAQLGNACAEQIIRSRFGFEVDRVLARDDVALDDVEYVDDACLGSRERHSHRAYLRAAGTADCDHERPGSTGALCLILRFLDRCRDAHRLRHRNERGAIQPQQADRDRGHSRAEVERRLDADVLAELASDEWGDRAAAEP
jgi:hypothetical protein